MDIIQLFSTGSVPAIVAGTVLGLFELGERFASQRAKDALSKWLLTFDVQKAKALPEGTQELFERIFGERHFSLKCFVRSAAFSVGAMVFLSLLICLIYPNLVFDMWMNDDFWDRPEWGPPRVLILWLPWSILIDYVSLFKTRLILGVLARIRRTNKTVALAILGIDYIIYKLLFSVGWKVVLEMSAMIFEPTIIDPSFLQEFINDIINNLRHSFFIPLDIDQGLTFILFWAGFAPSLWMWLYVLALFVTRALLRSEKLVTWLRWALDVEKTPFRSIGAVAAALAFIASVVIILVSAEVSRISAAS